MRVSYVTILTFFRFEFQYVKDARSFQDHKLSEFERTNWLLEITKIGSLCSVGFTKQSFY